MAFGTNVPPDFKECCMRYSLIVQFLIKKVPPVNSEVLIHSKNIESPDCTYAKGL